MRVTEAVHRLRDQRAAVVSLHAQEPELVQVSRLATRRLVAVRVFHYDYDRHEHYHPYDEGLSRLKYITLTYFAHFEEYLKMDKHCDRGS